jgi:hypothetical protein
VGVLIGGENAVRAAHSLAAEPSVDDLVVIGPATSNNFKVVKDPTGLDVLVGSGADAPRQARRHDLPLVWDGDRSEEGVLVWGASILGLAAAIGARQRKPALVAAAHPDAPAGDGQSVRFARPVGATQVSRVKLDRDGSDATAVELGRSYNEYAACVVQTKKRQVTVVDVAAFLSGIALAAGVAAIRSSPTPVWDRALPYLEMAHSMGLVMAEAPA